MFGWIKKQKHKKDEAWLKKVLLEIEELNPDNHKSRDGEMYSVKRLYSVKDEEAYFNWEKQVKTETFQERLLELIENKGMTNREFYKAAYMDRKLFSAINNNPLYQPKKETAVACCFGLKLDLAEAEKMLKLAGYTLSLSIRWDRIIYYCFEKGITDIDVVNDILYEAGAKCIGVAN